MKRKVEEDEKNEKIVRNLMKLPSNRRCINCNSQGPQYVCTNFSTFVCSTCSGIHREFSHRVKSVSMATFSAEDVAGLREGGNEHAKEVYFRQWDSQHQSLPDNRNVEGLRKFIKHVYVDRRYCGEKGTVDRPSIPKRVEREDSFTYRNGVHRMLSSDIFEQRSTERSMNKSNVDRPLTPKRMDREYSFTPRSGLHRVLSSEIFEQRSVERSGFSGRSGERDSGSSYGERRNNGNGKESEKHGGHSGLHRMLPSEISEQRSVEKSGFSGSSDERDSGNGYGERRNIGNVKESQKHGDRSVLHKMLSSDTYEQRSTERSGFSGASDERDSGNNNGERRNNGNGKESQKHVDRKRISTYFEVVDDRFRDDISETTGTYNMQRKLSNQQIALDSSRPREVRSLRDILDRIPTLQLREALKEDGGRPSDSPSSMQRTESTTKPRHTDEHSTKPRNLDSMGNEKHTLGSAYSISSDPEPASKQSTKPSSQSISKPASSSSSDNPSTIGCPTPRNQSKAASNAKNLDSVVPAAKPMDFQSKEPTTGKLPRTPSSSGVSPATHLSNASPSSPTSTFLSPRASTVSALSSLTISEVGTSSGTNQTKQDKDILHPQCSVFPDTALQSTSSMPSSSLTVQSSQFVPQHIPQASSGVATKSLPSVHQLGGKKELKADQGTGPSLMPDSGPLEQKSSGRKEIPQHLFVATHSSAPAQSPGWQALHAHVTGPGLQYSLAPVQSPGWQAVRAHVMGQGLQYSPASVQSPGWQVLQANVMGYAVKVPTVYQPANQANTFDLKNASGTHLQSSMSPSVASWHGSQPIDSPSVQWLPQQSSPYGIVLFQSLSSPSGMSSSSYIRQQLPNNPQPASTLNTNQHPGGEFSTPAIHRSSSSFGGNPFA
ncbi:hypothetical protein CXB51_023122 [Gossypium anomalum]|uniref:Arf-GAP domain-containing protein n=1 Tax=Gossypium anomalum TaxID=47600 RepID=A0A8J6CU17_9ROSI|nr:hypothetical protein CXB51_023122 [Gossypium anomalum]